MKDGLDWSAPGNTFGDRRRTLGPDPSFVAVEEIL